MSTKESIISGLIWKFAERITAQAVSLLVSIVLARLLMPDDYGAVTMVMVFISLANVFVSNGLGSALIQKQDADELDFSSVFYINLVLGLALYVVLFLIAPYIALFYNMPVLSPVLRVLAIRIPVASINSVQQAYVSKNMLFKKFFWSTLFGTVLSGIVGIYMAYQNWGVWALVAQYLTNTCVDTIVLGITVSWRPILKCSWNRAQGLISYGWKLLFSGLLDTGYNELRSLIIGKVYSPSDLAYYNQGDKYPKLIVVNVNSSISSVLFPAMSLYQNDIKKVKEMTRRAVQVSSYLMWPLMIGLAVIAEPMVRIILTEKWLPCVPYLRVFCLSYGLWPIHTSNLQALNALGRSDLFLHLEIIKKFIGIVTLLIAIPMGPYAIAVSLLVVGIISTVVNGAPSTKLLKYSFREQFSDIMPSFVLSLLMGSLVLMITNFNLSDGIMIILQIVAGGAIYIIGSHLTKQKGYMFCMKFLQEKLTNKKM